MKTYYFDLFEISLEDDDYLMASHPAVDNDEAVEDIVLNRVYVREQLEAINPEFILRELREYGAWEDNELFDFAQNERRIVWVAAHNIREEENERNT